MNIFIIENDPLVAKILQTMFVHIPQINCVESCENSDFALTKACSQSFDLVLIDIFSRDQGAYQLELLAKIRQGNPSVIIIAISGVHNDNCIKQAFAAGAHDFIAKPFSREELKARVLRWNNMHFENKQNHDILKYQELSYHADKHEFYFKTDPIQLTPKNKLLLSLFLKKAECLITQEYLQEKLWGDYFLEKKRNVRSNIHLLKKSLHGVCDDWICNARGEGYILQKKLKKY